MTDTIMLNGFRFYFRLLTLSDKTTYLDAFNNLSTLSKKYRFHYFKKSLTEAEIDFFLNIDNHNHLAIGAFVKIKNKEYGAGLIRYVRERNNTESAEVGLTILDSFQHYGLGSLLYIKLMAQAKIHGVKSLSNHLLNDNNQMKNLLKKFNGKYKTLLDGTCLITVPI